MMRWHEAQEATARPPKTDWLAHLLLFALFALVALLITGTLWLPALAWQVLRWAQGVWGVWG